MRRSGIVSVVGLSVALAASGFGSEVIGQGSLTIGGSNSNFGSSNLASGFMPDPVNIHVTSGGNLDAGSMGLGSGCVGHVTRQPDYILHLTSRSPSLRIYVTVPGAAPVTPTDTTLLVNAAHGHWHCNDDSYGTANPTVDLPNASPGQYDIWIGSYQSGHNVAGTLHITELDSNHP